MKQSHTILEVSNLSVQVGTKEVLSDVNLKIGEGEIHALLGQNGSGKTSLMMTIMGFSAFKVTQGSIAFQGKDITDANISERSRLGLAIAQQRPPTIAGITLRRLLSYLFRNEEDPAQSINALAKATNTETLLDRDINSGLSGGEIKRSELVQMLALSPLFSLLDEPDSGVDSEALNMMADLINRLFSLDVTHPARRKAGLIITHNGSILNRFPIDKAHVMLAGHIVCSAHPSLVLENINRYGYNACMLCSQEKEHDL